MVLFSGGGIRHSDLHRGANNSRYLHQSAILLPYRDVSLKMLLPSFRWGCDLSQCLPNLVNQAVYVYC